MSALSPPSPGRVVWFYANKDSSVAPMAAHVIKVHNDRSVNLVVFGPDDGSLNFFKAVPLIQPGDPDPAGSHARWMPYQIGQAQNAVGAKTPAPAPAPVSAFSKPAA